MDRRALSPLVGTVLLVALTVAIAATVGAMVATPDLHRGGETVRLTASADAATNTLSLTHDGGDPLDPDALTVRIRVEGTPLDHQPPVPFFSATGFESGPTGPFNSATTGNWTAGETGTLELASTNSPGLADDDRIEFTVLEDETVIATAETTAR